MLSALTAPGARDVERGAYAVVPTDRLSETSSGGSDYSDDSATSIFTEGDTSELLKQFEDGVASGELDFYTCLSLSHGSAAFTPKMRSVMYFRLPTLLALQLLVPASLLSYQLRHWHWGAKKDTLEFRLVGFIVYLFSVWRMYEASTDECRLMFLQFATKYSLAPRFTYVAVLGEVVAAFCGTTLVITLFTVFCTCEDPFSLVINCLAINFLCNVDNEFVDEELKKDAIISLRQLLGKEDSHPVHKVAIGLDRFCDQISQCCTLDCTLTLVAVVRNVGTLVIGHILAFTFLLARSHLLEALESYVGAE